MKPMKTQIEDADRAALRKELLALIDEFMNLSDDYEQGYTFDDERCVDALLTRYEVKRK